MLTGLRVDLVHTSPVVSSALRRDLQQGTHPVTVTTTVHSWRDFQEEWDFAGDFVVLDALLDDHVPLPLKVRALRRLGSLSIVLGPGRDTPFASRCVAEGALAWIEPTIGLPETTAAIRQTILGRVPEHAWVDHAPAPTADLTDRELQICSLYAAMRGHSPTTSAVSSGCARRRSAATSSEDGPATGPPVSRRTTGPRSEALIVDGWFLDPRIWLDAGRP